MKEDNTDLEVSNKVTQIIECFKKQVIPNDSESQGQKLNLKRLSLSIEILELLNSFIAKNGHEDSVLVKNILNQSFNLKLHSTNSTVYGNISLKNFEKLLTLELIKLPFKNIVGLRELAPHLLTLICNNVQLQINDLLQTSNDETIGLFSLKLLKLSKCNLEQVSFLEFMLPNLEILDLSYNNIKQSTINIENLNNIQVLNLGYNQIKALTFLPTQSLKNLTNLYLPFNLLSNLNGIEKLKNLAELDVSNNVLVDEESIQPLLQLKHLRVFNMQSNPFCSHKTYYFEVLKSLHEAALNRNFMLDGRFVTQKDKQKLKVMYTSNPEIEEVAQEAIESLSRPQDQSASLEQTDEKSPHLKKRYPHTKATITSHTANKVVNLGASTSKDVHDAVNLKESHKTEAILKPEEFVAKPVVKLKGNKKKKAKKTVDQIINFSDEEDNVSLTSQTSSTIKDDMPNYKAFQQEIERLRAAHGSSWLASSSLKASSLDIFRDMATKSKTAKPKPTIDVNDSSIPKSMPKSIPKHFSHTRSTSDPSTLNLEDTSDHKPANGLQAFRVKNQIVEISSSCKDSYLLPHLEHHVPPKNFKPVLTIDNANVKQTLTLSDANVKQAFTVLDANVKQTLTVSDANVKEESLKRKVSEMSEGIEVLSQIPSQEEDMFLPYERRTPDIEDDEDEEETLSDDNVFFTSREDYEDPIVLFLREPMLIEKNALNGNKIESLDLNALLSAQEVPVSMKPENEDDLLKKTVTLKLKFSSVKKNKSRRTYLFQNIATYEALMDRLNPYLQALAEKELDEGAMQCLKCSSLFSKNMIIKRYCSLTDLQTQLQNNRDLQQQDACPFCKSFLIILLDKDVVPIPIRKTKDNLLNSIAETGSGSGGSGITTLSVESMIPWAIEKEDSNHEEQNLSSSYLWGHLSAIKPITWEIFVKTLDHNGKVFLEFQLFSGKEDMLAAIQCTIASKTELGTGWFVLSNQKMYLFHGREVNQGSLHTSIPLQEFVLLYLLHSNQGFVLTTTKNSYTFIIADSMITLEFVCYLKGLLEQKALHMPKLKLQLEDFKPDLVPILKQWSNALEIEELGEVISLFYFQWDRVTLPSQLIDWKSIALILTNEFLLITLYVEENLLPKPLEQQAIANLVSIHVFPSLLQIGLHFYDEDSQQKEKVWLLKCATLPSIKTLLKFLKPIWESAYSQPLELKTTKDCKDCSTIIDKL